MLLEGALSLAFELSGPAPLSPSTESCVYCVDRRASLARRSCEPVLDVFYPLTAPIVNFYSLT